MSMNKNVISSICSYTSRCPPLLHTHIYPYILCVEVLFYETEKSQWVGKKRVYSLIHSFIHTHIYINIYKCVFRFHNVFSMYIFFGIIRSVSFFLFTIESFILSNCIFWDVNQHICITILLLNTLYFMWNYLFVSIFVMS